MDDAVRIGTALNRDGFRVSLDHLGEEVHDQTSAMAAVDEYVEGLDRIASEGLDANISVKPTQLGLAIDEGLAMDAVARLAGRAHEIGTTVTIDMEDSRYTEATIRLFEKGQAIHGNLGIALQAYLRRTSADLHRLLQYGGHIRLCKGAYVEEPDTALQSGKEICDAYSEQLRILMSVPGTTPAVATHDDSLIELARELAVERREPFEFQMLYGVRPDLQRNLLAEGYPLRVYLPYGSQWYPYLTRRLAERPANALFFARAVLGAR